MFLHTVKDFTYDDQGRVKEVRSYFQPRYPTGPLTTLNIGPYFYTKDSTYHLSKSLTKDASTTFIYLEFRNKNGKLKLEKYGHLKDQKAIYTTVNTFSYDALSKVVSIGYRFETGAKILGPYISVYKNKYDKPGDITSIEEFFKLRGDGVSTHAFYLFDKQGRITCVMKDCETWTYSYQ